MLRPLVSGFAFIVAMVIAAESRATDSESIAVEGTYFLLQEDGFQRVLTFDRGGNIYQISDQETLIGFTTSQGAWAQSGPGEAKPTVISFNYDIAGSDEVGATAVQYVFTFSDLVDGRYQIIDGSYAGKTYAEGQNPLSPTEDPVRTFGTTFAGKRVNAQ